MVTLLVEVHFTNTLDKDVCKPYCPSNNSVPGCPSKNIHKPRNDSGAFFIGTQKEGIY